MTPDELREARHRLGLTLSQMARMLGYRSDSSQGLRTMADKLEQGVKPIREPQRRLIEAYLRDYRPPDWPTDE